jgi:hypothetical protein
LVGDVTSNSSSSEIFGVLADLSPALVLMTGVKSGAEFCAMMALGSRAREAATPGLKLSGMDVGWAKQR